MANLVKYDPFAELQSLQKQFFGDDWFGSEIGARLPTTDVYTVDDKQLTVEAHLPYFEEKDVDVQLSDGALEIRAERHEQEKDKKKKYVIRESSSSFYRRFRLPDNVNEKHIEADFKDGILRVTVPFKELPKPKKISIKTK